MIPRPSGPATPIVRYALLAAVAVWVVLTLIPRGGTIIYLWPWPIVLAASLLVPLGVWLQATLTGRAERLGGVNDWAVVAVLLTLFAAAFGSPYRDTSVRALWLPLAGTSLLYLLAQRLRHEPDLAARVAHGLAALLAMLTISSLGLWWLLTVEPTFARTAAANAAAGTTVAINLLWEARNPHPFGHANYVAGGLLLLLPWGIWCAATTRSVARIAWSVVVLAAVFCLFTTGSRAAVIALAVLAVLGGVLLVRQGVLSRRVALVAVLLGLAAALGFAVVNPRVRGLLRASPGAATNDGDRQRAAMLQAGWQMGQARPALGWGPGTTALAYPRFRAGLTGGVDTALQLHSTPAQIFADTGFAGIAAALLLAGCALVSWWRNPSHEAQVAGLALAGYGTFALFDYQLDVPFFALAVATSLALVLANPSVAAPKLLPRWRSALVLFALLAAVLWYSVPAWRSQRALAEAATALEAGDIAAFDRIAQEAAGLSRTDTTALNALAMQRSERALRATTPAGQQQLAQQAVDLFSASLLRNPDQELCLTNLAWLQLRTDPRLAAPHFLAAAKLVPDKEGLFLGLAYGLLAEGKSTAAVNALALECLSHPAFMLSPQWRDNTLAPLREAALLRVGQRAGELAEKFPRENWNHTELAYLSVFARWLVGRAPAAEVQAVSPLEERRRFFSDWEKPEVKLLPDSREALRRYYLARHLAPPDDAWLDAIESLASAAPAQQRERLRDPSALAPGLIGFSRAQRVGYGILVKNLDAPVPVDLYYEQHNRLMEDFFDFLFPSQLRLPGPMLLAELEAVIH